MQRPTRFAAAFLVLPLTAWGQVSTRAEEIQQERREKAQNTQPEELSGIEHALNEIARRRVLERLTAGIAGIRVGFGGLVSGSGFALGPEYVNRTLAGGNIFLRASARASAKRYQRYDLQFGLPRLAGGKASLDFLAVRRDSPGINYYGPGPDSQKSGRSNYRLEDTSLGLRLGVYPLPRVRLGVMGDYLLINVGPGTDKHFISTDLVYSPQTTPGIDRQTDFLRGGVSAAYDWRDHPGGPRSGGNYSVEYSYYGDRKLDAHTFRRLDVDLQQYFPFFNLRRVIALRAKTVLSYANPGQRVPFYLQPVVGGSETLRGFRPFRFHDDNMLLMNAEYRWESFSGLDMALFFDAGKVFPRRANLNFKDLEGSAGFGFRFNVRNSVFLRIDVGFSHEGYQLWLKFNNVF